MKSLLGLFAFVLVAGSVTAETLPLDEQRRLIESYLSVVQPGKYPERALSMHDDVVESDHGPKCGMSAAADFSLNRSRMDKELLASYGFSSSLARPAGLNSTYNSPGGRFKIHYSVVAGDSNVVYQATTDQSPANGIPDYIDGIARILDSTHNYAVNLLGYPAPPSDGFYDTQGGDSLFDVYIRDLSAGFFGLAYIDSVDIDGPFSHRATSYIELENDFFASSRYRARPLDAVRVTAAHEYFHAVQFGIDYTEAEEFSSSAPRRYWMEMSAVWMEEEQYDGLNDYYGYLPTFFNRPGRSLQQFASFLDLHPYASAVFPIFLSEKYGKEVIRDVWRRCGELGQGASFLIALEEAMDSVRGVPDSISSITAVVRDFTVWNWFTGERAAQAPQGTGYSEAAAYPQIPFDSVTVIRDFAFAAANANPRSPDHCGAAYLHWDAPDLLRYDTIYTYWNCLTGTPPNCTDSVQVTDTTLGYDFKVIDSIDNFITLFLAFDPRPGSLQRYDQDWGLSVLYELGDQVDSFVVDTLILPDPGRGVTLTLAIPAHRDYKTITLILTPTSEVLGYYRTPVNPLWLGLLTDEESGSAPQLAKKFYPYPNPAVINEMRRDRMGFVFSYPSIEQHLLVIDIFTESGERVRTIEATSTPLRNAYTAEWDFTTDKGKLVGSGVYLLYGRLYDGASGRDELLAEERSKLLIVR